MSKGARQLKLYRPETRDKLELTYINNGIWTPEAYPRICWMLRDIHENIPVRMDPQLIAILDWVQTFLAAKGFTGPLHILSGYRSPRTNAATEGAKRNSMHLYGKAVDIRIPGLSAEYLGKLMAWLSQGGVGTYANDNFVHIDTGQVRLWNGSVPRRGR